VYGDYKRYDRKFMKIAAERDCRILDSCYELAMNNIGYYQDIITIACLHLTESVRLHAVELIQKIKEHGKLSSLNTWRIQFIHSLYEERKRITNLYQSLDEVQAKIDNLSDKSNITVKPSLPNLEKMHILYREDEKLGYIIFEREDGKSCNVSFGITDDDELLFHTDRRFLDYSVISVSTRQADSNFAYALKSNDWFRAYLMPRAAFFINYIEPYVLRIFEHIELIK